MRTVAAVGVLATAWLAACAESQAPPPSALAAGVLGNGLRPEDRAAAVMAEQVALDDGRVVEWGGTRVAGRIQPLGSWTEAGRPCRAYAHTLLTEDVSREWRAAACRGEDGRWTRHP